MNIRYSGNVHLFAHSMGTIVAGEALRLAGTNRLVRTYVPMQAAVAAHAYDPSTPERSLGVLDSGTPDRHAFYWTSNSPCYFDKVGGAERYVNFFNRDDWALVLLWRPNQDLKPDAHYEYFAPGAWYPDRELFRKFGITELGFPIDTFEIFALCVEARCQALGAEIDVGGPFATSTSFNQLDLNSPPFEFGGTHKGHSGQFRSTNMKRWLFWRTLLQHFDLSQ